MHRFKAYRTFQDDKGVSSRFVEMTEEELDPGDVLVRTKYSTINYKDALSYNGAGRIMRKFPTVGGIDMAGTVEGSADPRFRRGDKVIVHAYDFGVAHDGGYAEYTRVPADWVVRRPKAMTGLKPDQGPVAVTGATGGVGSVAIEVLTKRGYHVVAITGKEEASSYLRGLGAKEIRLRQSIDLANTRPLDKAIFAGAIDNLGGDLLAWLLSTMKIGGTVASVGLAADSKLNTTVMPFILRGVALLGVDSANCSMDLRQKIWDKLAVDWRPDRVHDQVHTIDFEDLPMHFDAYLKGLVRGRTVVRIGPDSHP